MRYIVNSIKKKITQIIQNGDFLDGTNHFTFIRTTGEASDGALTVTLSEQASGTSVRVQSQVTTKSSHKYYITVDVKPTNTGALFGLIGSTPQLTSINTLTANQFNNLRGIFTSPGDSYYPIVTGSYASGNVGDKYYIRNFMAFDLTEDFGAGNEPTDPAVCASYYSYITDGSHYNNVEYLVMDNNNLKEVIG